MKFEEWLARQMSLLHERELAAKAAKMSLYSAISAENLDRSRMRAHLVSLRTRGQRMDTERPEVGAQSTSAEPAGSDSLTAREMLAPLEGDLKDLKCKYALDSFDTSGRQVECGRPAIKRAYLDDGIIFPMDYCRKHWKSVHNLPVVQMAEVIDLDIIDEE